MKYDFETVVDRSGGESAKWNDMAKIVPDVPKGIVPLSVADMEFKNPPQIMEGLRNFLDTEKMTLGYASSTERYDAAVSEWMKNRHGWDVDMRWNVKSPGIVTALFASIRAFTDPGDGVIIFTPVYYPFKMGIELNNRTVVDIPLISNGCRYDIDWPSFECAAAEPSNKLLIFCSPHNPVGRVWTKDELMRLSEICHKNDVLVICDEIHHDLIMPGFEHTVYATVSKCAEQHCAVCTSPSKTFSLAGLQTSNVFVPNDELRKKLFDEMFAMALFTLNAVGYKACEIAYTQCGDWLEQAITYIAGNTKYVEDYISTHIPQITVYPLEGTYLQWWDCRALFDDYKKMEELMTQKALLFLDEGYMFGKAGEGFERVNLACPRYVLEAALERLYTALQAEKM